MDRLPAGQIEALYVLLRGMRPDSAESPVVANDASGLDDWHPSPDAPVVRNLSVAGIAAGSMISPGVLRRSSGAGEHVTVASAHKATSVTAITVVRQLVAVIAKGFILAKDNCRIGAIILRDSRILRDLGGSSTNP